MNPAENSYRPLRRVLEDLIRHQDGVRLRGLLAGIGLPALGPDLEPADLLLRAIESPFDANLGRRLAHLLAPLVDQEADVRELRPSRARLVGSSVVVSASAGD